MAKVKLTNKGIREALEDLAKRGKDIDVLSGQALKAGGKVLVGGMRRRAPKDTHNLEEKIQMKGPVVEGNYQYIEVGLPHDRALVDAETARYGTAQEYGTSSMAAQPYIRPTIDEDMRKARKAMLDELKAGME